MANVEGFSGTTEQPETQHEAERDVDDACLWAVQALRGRRLVAITGAGISTPSGIPDYRGPAARGRPRRPMTHDTFVGDASARQRYWCRATLGWQHLNGAVENDAHRALAGLEQRGVLGGVITQNVDRLHQRAGSRVVVELHGTLHEVRCLGCGHAFQRDEIHRQALHNNTTLSAAVEVAPDGDVDVDERVVAHFQVPTCTVCAGVLMPAVVFFGGVVPPPIRQSAEQLCADADALLVCGTSLEVLSGRRLVEAMARRGCPVVIANDGPTRADDLATVRIAGLLERVLPSLVTGL